MSLKIKQVKIKNFKCFATEKTIDFSKLTIFTGSNSSGKSAILNSILGTVQSGEFPLKFSPNGKYVNMGDFKEISNKHLSEDISFAFTVKHKNFKGDYIYHTIWQNDKRNSLPELKTLTITSNHLNVSLNKDITEGYLLNFLYDPSKDPDSDEQKDKEAKVRIMDSMMKTLTSNTKKSKKQLDRDIARETKYIENAFKKTVVRNFKINDLETIQEEARKKANMNLNYTIDVLLGEIWIQYSRMINAISSFRNHPDRTYLEQSKDKWKVDKFGDGYLDQIILWEQRKDPKFTELVKIMRDDLGLLSSLRANRKIGGGRYEILVKIKNKGTETSLFDVGFGVNQFMPIIVADLQLPEGSTLFVAEPEIHLHPNIQAKFADYVVKQIDKNKKNYVVETHSEYFLNRVRLAIVKGSLLPENLSVYYLENNGTDVDLHKLKFTKDGQIKNAPDSFFDTYMMDLKEIAFSF